MRVANTRRSFLSLRFVRFLNRVFGISPGRRCQSSLQKYTRSSSFLRLSSRQIEGLSPPQSGDDSTKSLPHGNYLPTNFIFLTSSSSVPGRLFTYIPIFISSHIYRLSWVSQLLRDPHERMQPQVLIHPALFRSVCSTMLFPFQDVRLRGGHHSTPRGEVATLTPATLPNPSRTWGADWKPCNITITDTSTVKAA